VEISFVVTVSASKPVIHRLNMYRDQARQFGCEADGTQLGQAVLAYVAATDERARAEAGIESLKIDRPDRSHSTTCRWRRA
jgi:hypothetical protein